MDVKDMETFIQHIHTDQELSSDVEYQKPDLYLGSRFLEESKVDNMPRARKIILWIAKLVTKIFYGAQISDPHNGYRVISLSMLKKFIITADGMHYANEVNEQIKKHHMKYREIPVHIRYTDYSLTK